MREHRRRLALTQAQLGAQVGVSRQSIVSIEGGNYSPSVYLALRIAAALGATVEELFPLHEEARR
ncbi:helix-turn-helix transcriptional regulator [Tomitella fengzijianii]|uniref:helix-turn-helix transcriptional regulator n=1 Tax=Tomitella fengzijianii TaxID=2597660 RepID=UPI001E5AD6C9|nr:helix-turn-helix transcriptional regulator [Tomitella fengzijianii]